MIQRDYFMRMIEQFAQALATILSSRKKGNWREMEQNISAVCEKMLGVDYAMFRHIESEQLIELLRSGEFIDSAKAYVLASLFYEQADALSRRREQERASALFLKSATLYLEILKSGNTEINAQTLPQIAPALANIELSGTTAAFRRRLFLYYELCGDFDKAENILFELAEAAVTGMVENGILFYNRLAEKSDADLQLGNFSSQEVAEGRADFVRQFMEKE